jgi:hypothetical protein
MNQSVIEFLDFPGESKRGRLLGSSRISIWYNLNGSNKMYAATFSNDIVNEKAMIRIGKIGPDYCFVFSDNEGMKIYRNGNGRSKKRNMLFNCKGFVKLFFPDMAENNEGKDRKVFDIQKINDEVYILKNEVK